MLSILIIIFSLGSFAHSNVIDCPSENIKDAYISFSFAFDNIEEYYSHSLKTPKQESLEQTAFYMSNYFSDCTIAHYAPGMTDDDSAILETYFKQPLNKYSPGFSDKYIGKGYLTLNGNYVINIEDIVFTEDKNSLSVSISVNVSDVTIKEQMAQAVFTSQIICSGKDCKDKVIEQAVCSGMPDLVKQVDDVVGVWKSLGAPYKLYVKGVSDGAELVKLINLVTADHSKYESFDFIPLEPGLIVFDFKSKLYKNDEFLNYMEDIIGCDKSEIRTGHMSFYNKN